MAIKISMEQVIPEHQVILEASAVIAQTVRSLSDRVGKGDSSVNIPTLAARSGQEVAVGASLTKNNNNYGDDSLALDRVAGDAFDISTHDEEENILNGLEDGLNNSLKAMAKVLDKKLITQAIAAAGLTETARTADFYNDVVDMVKAFDDATIPLENRYLAVTPADYAALLKTKDFVRFDAKGTSDIPSGQVGEILGFTVVRPLFTSGEGFTESFAYHSFGLCYAWHGETKVIGQPNALNMSETYSVSRKFGSKALQSGAMIKKWGVTGP